MKILEDLKKFDTAKHKLKDTSNISRYKFFYMNAVERDIYYSEREIEPLEEFKQTLTKDGEEDFLNHLAEIGIINKNNF